MLYTEKELKEATQFAYLSFLKTAQANLKAEGKKGPFTLRELISSFINTEASVSAAKRDGIDERKLTLKEIVKYSDLLDADKSIIEEFSEEMFDWQILDIRDMNPVNGFYACCIGTSPQKAIIAFRGSENMKKFTNMIDDWCRADIGLLNSASTRQQEEAERYGDEIIEKGLLDEYESVAVTGHSLGGNLATHFTIAMATEEREGLFDKIKQSINFDGPGVSDEYLEAHEDKIAKASPKLTHLKWSAVGDLLFDIPGEHSEFLAINEELYKDNPKERVKYKVITRHSTKSIMFNEAGEADRGKQDLVSKGLSLLSKTVDKVIPGFVTTEIFAAIDWVFERILEIKENRKIVFKEFSWSERFAGKGSFLGKCGSFINNAISTLKEGALALTNEINELFAHGYTANNYTPKVALADVYGAVNDSHGFNATCINSAMLAFGPNREEPDIEI